MADVKRAVDDLISVEQQLVLVRGTPREEKWASRVEAM